MTPFLKYVAEDLFREFGKKEQGLSDITIVFPNRRAKIFFDEYLAECTDSPLWSPSYLTIDQLFESQTELCVADPLLLVMRLYNIYHEVTGSTESIDSFWPWAEIMLNDFSDIDSNLVDANLLFANIEQQREMVKDLSYLTDVQKAAIEEFFKDFSVNNTGLKKRYMEVWTVMGTIYSRFKQELIAENLCYDGLMKREVIQNIDTERFTSGHYAFIGFNRLSKSEESLFDALQKAGKALFYWDYDNSYVDDSHHHEAGLFLKHNVKKFPNRLGSECFNNMTAVKEMTIVESSTDNAQARYIPDWMDHIDSTISRDTAIILCDGSLLQPVLHCIPSDKISAVNITMGFPLTETPIYGLTDALIELQISAMKSDGKFHTDDILRLLDNPLVKRMSEKVNDLRNSVVVRNCFYHTEADLKAMNAELSNLFTVSKDNSSLLMYLIDTLKLVIPLINQPTDDTLFIPLNQEAMYRVITQINRFIDILEDGKTDLKIDTLCKLIRKVISGMSIPFHGEPIVGMQVMGLLETRNLDFKHILLLSANEGSLPNKSSESSFIPYNLRVAFSLTTMKDKSAIAAYNFYHLIQRAESVTLMYNGNDDTTGINKGQISRYLLQLIVDNGVNIKRLSLNTERKEFDNSEIVVPKTESVLKEMCRIFDSSSNPFGYISPTTLNSYIDCPLKFYLRNIAKIKPSEKPLGEIDFSKFGTIFHESAELAYNSMAGITKKEDKGGLITKEMIDNLLNDESRLTGFIRNAFNDSIFNHVDIPLEDYNSTQILNFEVIKRYLQHTLRTDRDLYAPFDYISSETPAFFHIVNIKNPLSEKESLPVKLKGVLDRVDSKDGIVRIVDYKTGRIKNQPKNLDGMFLPGKNRNYHALQIFFYASLMCHQKKFADSKIAPVLIYSQKTNKVSKEDLYYSIDGNIISDFKKQWLEEFDARIKSVLEEIFNPENPFTQVEGSSDCCSSCDFARICRRK